MTVNVLAFNTSIFVWIFNSQIFNIVAADFEYIITFHAVYANIWPTDSEGIRLFSFIIRAAYYFGEFTGESRYSLEKSYHSFRSPLLLPLFSDISKKCEQNKYSFLKKTTKGRVAERASH